MKALQSKGLSQREACAIVKARRRSSCEKLSDKAQQDAHWAHRLTELAHRHADHGCRQLYSDYEREAADGDEYMNYKRFRRLYRLANLQFGRRRRRGRAKIVRGKPLRRATKPVEGWTLDFMHDRLYGGRAFRALTMEDEFSRTGLAVEMSFSFPSRSVVAVLDSVAAIYGYPKYLRIDNGLSVYVKLFQATLNNDDVEDARSVTMSLRRNSSYHGDTRSLYEPSTSFKRRLLPIGRSEHYLRGRERLDGPGEGILPSCAAASMKWRYSFPDFTKPYATRATLAATAVYALRFRSAS